MMTLIGDNSEAHAANRPPLPHTASMNAASAGPYGRPPPPPPPPRHTASSDSIPLASPGLRPPPPPSSSSTRRMTVASNEVHQYSLTGNYRDFRDYKHTEDGHWNDVPTTVITTARRRATTMAPPAASAAEDVAAPATTMTEAAVDNMRTTVDNAQLAAQLRELLTECDSTCSILNTTQKRMLEDTKRRLEELLKRLEAQQLAEHIYPALDTMVKAICDKDYAAAIQVQVALIQTDFDAEGRWLVGAKRLIELVQVVRAAAAN